MDWVFAGGLSHFRGLKKVVISYDIACQWFVHLRKRMQEWPIARRIPSDVALQPVIPAFHYPAHRDENHDEYNTRLCSGLGSVDGEAIERLWAQVGTLGVASKTMAPASRQLVIDDALSFCNWLKYISHSMFL